MSMFLLGVIYGGVYDHITKDMDNWLVDKEDGIHICVVSDGHLEPTMPFEAATTIICDGKVMSGNAAMDKIYLLKEVKTIKFKFFSVFIINKFCIN